MTWNVSGSPRGWCDETDILHHHPSLYVTLDEYEALFDGATADHAAIGEASTTYLESEVAVLLILEYQPLAKFIVMVRSPIEMAVSLHSQELLKIPHRCTGA